MRGSSDSDDRSGQPPADARSARDILVVDDTSANLVAVEAALAPLDCRLVFARSGMEGLAHLLEQDFAVILLDVQMPGMDGYECARLIRSRARNKTVPIIFVTAHSRDENDVLQAYQLGAVDFLFKPVHPEVLRAKVSVFVELFDVHAREQARLLQDQRRQLEAENLRREADQQRDNAAQLARLNEALALADRRKDEFLAILAHELRNPLAPLQTAIEVMRGRPDEPTPPRLLDILERQLRHITRLVDDLLEVSRITAGKIELRRSRVRLNDIVEHATVTSRPHVDHGRHELITVPPARSTIVSGDPVRLAQVVANLIHNAAKYTDPGGRIELAWGERDGNAFVRVTDNGRGIPADLIDRVFDMFVQERAGSDGAGGLGLGLALVQRLVTLHGGTVTASSEGPNRGSSFEVRVPLAIDEATLPLEAAPAPAPAEQTSRRVVVIDDNEDLRDLVAELLTSVGHQVTTAADGESGLALVRAQHPDVAFIDIGLPDLDGHQIARILRAELDRPMRLIAMTGYGQQSDRANALAAGFDVHITKPAAATTIFQALGD